MQNKTFNLARIQAFNEPLVGPPPLGWNGGIVLDAPEDRALRHSRHHTPVDRWDDTANYSLHLKGEYNYLGATYSHFGHLMAEMIHRAILYERRRSTKWLMVTTIGNPKNNFFNFESWRKEIYDFLGIEGSSVVVLNANATVETLNVWEAGSDLGGGCKSGYLEMLSDFTHCKLDRIYGRNGPNRHVYVSRNAYGSPGALLGERYIETILSKEGFEIFRPVEHPFTYQMEKYRKADLIIFPEGSACHGVELLGQGAIKDTIFLNRRENLTEVFRKVLAPRSAGYEAVCTNKYIGTLYGWRHDNHALSNLGLSIFDFDGFISLMKRRGFSMSGASFQAYKDECLREYSVYVSSAKQAAGSKVFLQHLMPELENKLSASLRGSPPSQGATLKGAIDNFYIADSRVAFSGWCFFPRSASRKIPDHFTLGDSHITRTERFTRNDIGIDDQFGFRVTVDDLTILPILLSGKEELCAVLDGEASPISLTKGVRAKILSAFLDGQLKLLGTEDINPVTSAVLTAARRRKSTPHTEVTPTLLSLGLLSYDESVIAGRDGHLFLYGGSNSIQKLYGQKVNPSIVARWEKLVNQRNLKFGAHRVKFAQIIFPEKQSILTDLYPINIDGPTKNYDELRLRLGMSDCFLDLHPILKELDKEGNCPFRRVDSHLSFFGALTTAMAIVRHLTGEDVFISRPALSKKAIDGDLGNKFGYGNIMEECLSPQYEGWAFAENPLHVVDEYFPEKGHIGGFREWRNESSLRAGRLLIFGNSMFERGGSAFGLSWWMARIFQTTRFVWSPRVDFSLVEKWRPDFVICQTVERFLSSVPVDIDNL